MTSEAVFVVEFDCSNCGKQWDDEYAERTEVGPLVHDRDVHVRNVDCEEFGMHNCDCCYKVFCPNCELADAVGVERRYPVGEEPEPEEAGEADA